MQIVGHFLRIQSGLWANNAVSFLAGKALSLLVILSFWFSFIWVLLLLLCCSLHKPRYLSFNAIYVFSIPMHAQEITLRGQNAVTDILIWYRLCHLLTVCKYRRKRPVSTLLHQPLTRGPGRLKPSDSAPVLQYGSGPSSDFLAKILGVVNPPFLCNTQFYFPLSSLLLHKDRRSKHMFSRYFSR
jgi:hypothetical protein